MAKLEIQSEEFLEKINEVQKAIEKLKKLINDVNNMTININIK